MYAVIRAGGKQYRVSPGDVIRVEKLAGGTEGKIEFHDVLAVSASEGQIGKPPSDVRVSAQVLGEGRNDKVLVFHYKRKKQYKKLRGHRQPFTTVRITEITVDGQTFPAPEPATEKAKPQAPPAAQLPQGEAEPLKAEPKASKAVPKKAAKKKATARVAGKNKKKKR